MVDGQLVLKLVMCMCHVSVCMYVHVQVVTCKGQKWPSDSLEMELQMLVSHTSWVLGAQLESFERAASALKEQAISPASQY